MNGVTAPSPESSADPDTENRIVYLMRGLPSSGKSHAARRLAGEAGVICETDAYFHTEVGSDPAVYDFDPALLDAARDWNIARYREALSQGRSPIVVDRGNGLSAGTQTYARLAVEHGYTIELREPDSPWWQEIRVLLKYPRHTLPILDMWADRLAEMNQSTHGTAADEIRRRMRRWKYDLSVDEILGYQAGPDRSATAQEPVRALRRKTVKRRSLVFGSANLPRPMIGDSRGSERRKPDSVLVFDNIDEPER